ncbi:hypothetical protein [Streptomyces lavendulocolor]|uniref:hypothetical protein n=1 Tax=Streptomyces lavendulocolor TaxID=67316 RepID=UPI0033D40325
MENSRDHARRVETGDTVDVENEPQRDDWPRLSRRCDLLGRARTARDRLYQRALPSDNEIRVKVQAAERIVARAEAPGRQNGGPSGRKTQTSQHAARLPGDILLWLADSGRIHQRRLLREAYRPTATGVGDQRG